MKRMLQLIAVVMLLPLFAQAQLSTEWEFQTVIPADTSVTSSHGAAFDGQGNVWHAPYYAVTTPDVRNNVYCYDVSGSPCDGIDPVYSVPAGDSTLYFGPITGLAADHNGNILVSSHGYRRASDRGWSNTHAFIIRLNHETGEVMDIGDVTAIRDGTVSHAFHIAADEFGYIYYSAVFGGQPIEVVDENFGEVIQVTDNRPGFARAIGVSRDGSRVYQPSNVAVEFVENGDTTIVVGRVTVYEGSPFTGYEIADTLSMIGMDPGAIAVCPISNVVYAAASGISGDPETDPERWHALTIYGFSPDVSGSYQAVDETSWDMGDGDPFNPIYRSLAISPDGLGLVVGSFSTSGAGVQYFSREAVIEIETSAGEELSELPIGYDLGQNYPNPFNPTTNINFEIGQSGMTTLRVYDMLGREVATLVNDNLQAGSHSASFDAVNLSSGTYIYRLESNGYRLTRKMMLVK